MAEHIWPINVIEREWPKVKEVPWAFASITFSSLAIGGFVVYFLFTTLVIPGKDSTIEALKQ